VLFRSGLYAGQYERLFAQTASRGLAAWLIDLSAGELEARNESVSIPDVDLETTADGDAILRLYQAGVFTGVDAAGTFAPAAGLTRAQAAVILARVLDPAQRVAAEG
jgi:ribosomal protein S18 acetylase RimI-like enzyme